ncbi:MAG: hypothetical protein ACK4PR_06235, partial [Gammaproteobacteria bacterium]
MGLGLVATSDAFALGNNQLGNGAFPGKVAVRSYNHPLRNNPSFNHQHVNNQSFNRPVWNNNHPFVNNNQLAFNTKNTFSHPQQSYSINNKLKNTNNNSLFIHSTPTFNSNNLDRNTISVANNFNHPITFNNANNKVIHVGDTTTHVIASGTNVHTVIHTTTQHIGPQNGNVVMQKPNAIVFNNGNRPIFAGNGKQPIVINNNNPVIITRPYGYGYNHYYWGGSYPYYYNNNVNDFLAIALGLSLIGNVAQFAAANSHTNTVVYQNYPPYATNAMSVYQPIPYAPTVSSSNGSKNSSTSSTSSQPVNVTVNTTVNTTTPSASPTGAATTTSTQSTTTTTPQTTAQANSDNPVMVASGSVGVDGVAAGASVT